jgi:hypothetical protein
MAHDRFSHGKLALPCAFFTHARRKISAVRLGRRTAKKVTHGARVANGVDLGLPCVGSKTHGKELAFVVRPRKKARQRIGLCRAPY